MPADAPNSRLIQFGDFAIDPRAGELFKKGKKIKLQQQPFQVLALLLEKPGDLVTRRIVAKAEYDKIADRVTAKR